MFKMRGSLAVQRVHGSRLPKGFEAAFVLEERLIEWTQKVLQSVLNACNRIFY